MNSKQLLAHLFATSITFNAAHAVEIGLSPRPEHGYHIVKQTMSLPLPPAYSQGELGICFAVVSSLLFDVETCRDKSGSLASCPAMPDTLRVSPLDASRFANTKIESFDDGRENFKQLLEGGAVTWMMEIMPVQRFFANASCASPTQIKYKGSGKVSEPTIWVSLKELHGQQCSDCEERQDDLLQELQRAYLVDHNLRDLKTAYSLPTFGEFLSKVLVPEDCVDGAIFDGPKAMTDVYRPRYAHFYPKEKLNNSADKNFTEMMATIKENLQKNTPMAVEVLTRDHVWSAGAVKTAKKCLNFWAICMPL